MINLDFINNYQSLILNLLKATVKKNNAIPSRIVVSFQTANKPRPFIIVDLMAMINHVAGTILEIICNG